MLFNILHFLFFTCLLIKRCMGLNIGTNKNKPMVLNFISRHGCNSMLSERNGRTHNISYKFENKKIRNSVKHTEINNTQNDKPFEQADNENRMKQNNKEPIINQVYTDNKHGNYDKNDYINKLYENEICNPTNYNVYIENNKLEEYISDVSVSKNEMCTLYEDMNLGRLFENLVAKLYYNKKINGFVHLYNGQEAISTGVIKNLRNSDFVVSTYRDHVHALSKNVSAKEILNELYGNYYGSTNQGKGGSMHIYSKKNNFIGGFGFIGEQIPIAVGLAYSILYKKEFPENFSDTSNSAYQAILENKNTIVNTASNDKDDPEKNDDQTERTDENDLDVVVCFLGDGTSNIGQFYESLNLASTYNLPIIFVIENNNWAIGMEGSRSSLGDLTNNYKKGEAFNVTTYKVDGNDVLSIYKIVKKKIYEIRKKKSGPVLIEAITYRTRGHSLADPDLLRRLDEKNSWKKIDPIIQLSNYMKNNNIVDSTYFENVKKDIQKTLLDAQNDADSNFEKSKNIDVCKLYNDNIFAPSEITKYQTSYSNYKKYDQLSDNELAQYYQSYMNEINGNSIKNEKYYYSQIFDKKELPLIIN
ncbi:pyruvate dehydrogenase E1 component subunit alpha, putative [Plasmodium chabaudi adami]|uniref:Pyruvate dehydrogenase E1 component subunit alpha, putative n=1 Tax=Plasmodium chabaudi adami TaxID=5826 RepID=A0A1C6YCN7_PLACE|nr:pyruvate dehydrogenase E1 component subunit alpha, putative [Plasmodium chabaudi adami]